MDWHGPPRPPKRRLGTSPSFDIDHLFGRLRRWLATLAMMGRAMNRAIVAALTFICAATSAQAQNLSTDDLARRTIERRAVEAVIWGMPAVNYDLMLQEMLSKTNGKVNQVIYWGRPLDSKNQTLTPNPDALYFMIFFDTRNGPIVLDLPAGDTNGSFNGNIV